MTASWNNETCQPRAAAGETSEIYTGTVVEARPNPQADDDAPGDEGPDGGHRGAKDGAGYEDRRGHQQRRGGDRRCPPGFPAQRAGRGSGPHDADDQLLMKNGEVKLRFDEEQSA